MPRLPRARERLFCFFFPSGFFPSGLACFAGVVAGSGCRRVSSLFVFVAERDRKRGRRMGG